MGLVLFRWQPRLCYCLREVATSLAKGQRHGAMMLMMESGRGCDDEGNGNRDEKHDRVVVIVELIKKKMGQGGTLFLCMCIELYVCDEIIVIVVVVTLGCTRTCLII